MKKLMIIIASVAFMASCNSKDKQNAAAQRMKQATIDSISYANKQQRTIDSLQALTNVSLSAGIQEESPAMVPLTPGHEKVAPRKNIPSVGSQPAINTPKTTNNAPASQPQTNSPSGSTVAPADNSTVASTPEKKKGLNNAAKGAIIGLGAGAAAGAIIGKENRGKGAIIGGVAGAIGGAVGGAVLDKRKKNKAAEAAKIDSLRQDSIRRSK
ncbi:hypothetical protein CNR22_21125 [Sphingobacteriaceae bacterium]|nr:hypothetical protein CNR22_21125 [Sphingobacteriaceae bacterium]